MDIFSNRAGVELLRPTVYLKQITPGLQIPEEVKKAMIQKARKDMLEMVTKLRKRLSLVTQCLMLQLWLNLN